MNAYHQSLPKKRMSAGCLLFNEEGRILIVNPTYKEPWEIPGGVVEQDESPLQACVREIQEELDLHIQPKRLLCVDYSPTSDDRSESLSFIFYGDILSTTEISNITLQEKELSEYRFCTPNETFTLLNERVGQRIKQCLSVINTDQTLYLESRDEIL
jgi:8-oxo-dGTP diphosphatase